MPYERKLNEVWVYGIGHTIKIHIICWIVCDCIKNNLLDFQVCRIFSHPIVSTLLRCLDVPTFFPGAQLGVQYSSKYIQNATINKVQLVILFDKSLLKRKRLKNCQFFSNHWDMQHNYFRKKHIKLSTSFENKFCKSYWAIQQLSACSLRDYSIVSIQFNRMFVLPHRYNWIFVFVSFVCLIYLLLVWLFLDA